MSATVAHRLSNEGVSILLRQDGALVASILVTHDEARRFGWSVLADVDPEEAGAELTVTDENLYALRKAFSMAPAVARLVLAMFASKKPLHRARLTTLIGSRAEPRVIDVYMCKVRKLLGESAVEAVFCAGYALTDVGRRKVGAAIQADVQR